MTRCLGLGLGVVVVVIFILTGTTHAAVTVDFATDRGPVSSRYSGFHLGVTDTAPPDSVLLPLKPKFIGRPIVSYHRALALGAANEEGVAFSNVFSCCSGNYPGEGGNWAPWETYVTNRVNQMIGFGFTTNITWDIWNEPDNAEFWTESRARFFETYRRAVVIIRNLMPGSRVTGPAIAIYDQTYLQDFLSFAKANGVLPDLLSWHEIVGIGYIDSGFLTRVATMRAFMAANGISISDIEIDEMFPPTHYLKPATFIVSAANLQRAGILQAGRACWTESSGWSNCTGNSSGGTAAGVVTPPPSYQPRSAWWAMKAYADLGGRYVDLTTDASFDGLASWDASTGSIRLALGNVGGSATTEIRLVNLGSITAAASARVRVERIPNTEEAALSAPTVVTDTNLSVTGGELRIPISGSQVWDAYAVTVAFSQGKQCTSGPEEPDDSVIGHWLPSPRCAGGSGDAPYTAPTND